MRKFLLVIVLILSVLNVSAQRKVEKLDRGVVAVKNSAGNYFVSWRLLASDPEDIKFNVYVRQPAADFVKMNAQPQFNTNYQIPSSSAGLGVQIYVKPVINGIEGTASGIFTIKNTGFNSYRSAFLDVSFNPLADGLAIHQYSTKFVWPADLDGDGEYDYVVDRLSNTGGSHKVQAYLRNGTLLWTVDVGPNVSICQGQDDMVLAYDMDNDGFSDVVIKSSDGTVFANGKGVNGSTTLDTDNDGIIDYGTQNVKNPPQYMTVIDGLTGNEKNSIEMTYPSNYTRTNKSIFMGEEYSNLNGHMSVLYLDGKHPSVGFIYKTRTASDKYHWYYASAYGYNASGQWVNHYNWERGKQGAAEFHSIRAADVDFDGKDELLDGGYGIKYDGTLAFNAHISHGDRFRVGDIDPDRPGLETFAIQQNAGDMLGMIMYESGTGKAIKKWFMSAVGDVGRGECMDVDSTRLGYEMWSTMANIYDAKGNVLFEGGTPFPHEGVWWDGDLLREELSSSDGNGFNADIRKYDINSHAFGSRPIEFAKMTGWQVKSEYGVRPAFFGDIAGDWREEVLLEKRSSVSVTLKDINGNDSIGNVEACPGFVGFSTDYPTSNRIYCLMQNPAYRMQATTKGYYQSAFPDYYLGHNMKAPPVAPVQSAKLTWKSGTTFDKVSQSWLLEDEKTSSAFTDGDDVMFDISGDVTAIQMNSDLAPSKIWAMNPKGKDYILSGSGKLTGEMEFVKSMQGNFILNGNHTFTGKTTISEGILTVNGSLASPVEIKALGTLAGNAIINGDLKVNQGLHVEGGRLAPGNGLADGKLGKITINNSLSLAGKANLHFDIIPSSAYINDSLMINGDLNLTGVNNIVISTLSGTLPSGTYSLIKWTGTLTGSLANLKIVGISGIPVTLQIEGKTLQLVVNAVRATGKVSWTGVESSNWDFVSGNFKLGDLPTNFVTGDSVEVNDDLVNNIIITNDKFSTAHTKISNVQKTVTLRGTGGIDGTGSLVKTGKGLLNIESISNSYTGKTILKDALVQVANLADAGTASSLGAAAAGPANISLENTRLMLNGVTSNSNRGMTIIGADTLQVVKSNGVMSITGQITGAGKLVKSGPGQLNLSGSIANNYSGGTLISGGTLGLGTLLMNNSGLGSGPITLENGAKLIMYYSTGYGQSPFWNLNVPETHTATLITSGRCDINGSFNGGGTLNYYVSYSRTDLVASGLNFTGKLNITTDADGGDFRITTNANGFPKAQINLNNLVYMGAYASVGASGASSSTVVKLGSVTGIAGSKLGTGTWIIGSDNRDAVFNGVIQSGATISKVGTGSWTLSGANLNTTAFNISGGKLIVTNTTGSATGSGNVTVANTATLAGIGKIAGTVILNSGATLSPGLTTVGTLTLGSGLQMQNGSKTIIKVSSTNNDKVAVTGSVVLKGTLEMQPIGTTFTAGKSYTIFTAASATGNFDAIVPAIPGEGLEWNLSKIAEGMISVDVADGINHLKMSDLKVYPTMVKDFCTVDLSSFSGNLQFDLKDFSGRRVVSDVVDSAAKTYKINMQTHAAGMYFVSITSSDGSISIARIVKH